MVLMQNIQKKFREKNSDLIKAFLELKGHPDNYEVWAPYAHRGIVGFIDLVIESRKEISVFKFTRDAKDIEEDVKGLKLETSVYPKSRNIDSKEIRPYLVVSDSRKNRDRILTNHRLLEDQPFEILMLNEERGQIEEIFGLKYSIPRLFQSEGLRLEEGALGEIISRPDHEDIEEAILNLDNPPESIDKEIINKVDRYLKRNETPPEDVSVLWDSMEEEHKPYARHNPRKTDVKEPQSS